MWVLRKIQSSGTSWDNASPWKGCLHIDREGRAWYATDLAKPTQISSQQDAEECRETIKVQFPESEIQVAVYEEIFRSVFPPVAVAVSAIIAEKKSNANMGINISDWNWNDNGEEYDIPF